MLTLTKLSVFVNVLNRGVNREPNNPNLSVVPFCSYVMYVNLTFSYVSLADIVHVISGLFRLCSVM